MEIAVPLNVSTDKLEESLKDVIVALLNEVCLSSSQDCPVESVTSLVKRSVNKGPFTTKDIYFPKPPERINGQVSAEFAILKQDKNGTSVSPILAQPIAALIEENREIIEKKIGGKVMSIAAKEDLVKPTNLARRETPSGGMIAGIVIAVFIVVTLAALAVWHFRVKRIRSRDFSHMKEGDENVKTTREQVAAFENPGYDVAGAFDNEGIVAVNLSPFEDISAAHAASNPVYGDISMKVMSPQQSSHTEGAMANKLPKKEPLPGERKGKITTVDRNKNSGTQEEPHHSSPWANAGDVGSMSNPLYGHIGMEAMSPQQSSHTEGVISNELAKNEPLPEEAQAEITTVDRDKNAGTQEEPHYSSLWANAGEVLDKDQVKIDVQGEHTYQSLEKGNSSQRQTTE